MKKIIALLLLCLVCMSAVSCAAAAKALDAPYDGYYLVRDGDAVSVTNYHPAKIWALPEYQELAEYGEDVGLECEDAVYFLYIIDTKEHSEEDPCYYHAELDAAGALLFEEDWYFDSAEQKSATVDRLLSVLQAQR